jgi:hypothetical protein
MRRHACSGATRDAIAAQAELLCLCSLPCLGEWLLLQQTGDEPPDWAAAVRLLQRECSAGASRETAALLFESLAASVCDALASSAEDDEDLLASAVAHLYIAAKLVAGVLSTREEDHPASEPFSLLDALHDLLANAMAGG